MAQLLFDAPWWLPVGLAFLGVALFWNGNRRQEAKVRNAGLAFLLAAVLVMAVSYYVDTDLEKATKQSKELVYGVQKRDWPALTRILAPNTALHVNGFGEMYVTRNEIIGGAQKAVDQYGLKNVRILSVTPEQTDTVINITMTIMSEQDVSAVPVITTTWQFEWQQMGKTWTLTRITNIRIGNASGEAAARQFPRGK